MTELSPISLEEKLDVEKELRAKSALIMAIPDDYVKHFFRFNDDKTIWEAFKEKFGGTEETQQQKKFNLKA